MSKRITRNKHNVDILIVLAVFFVFIISLIFILNNAFDGNSYNYSKFFDNTNINLKNNLKSVLERQKDIDKQIKDNAANGGYTLDNPLIIENPYEISPLTALIIFNTDNDTSVKLDINATYNTIMEKSKTHIIPIYGLLSDATNYITLTLDDGTSKNIEIKTKPYNDNIYGLSIKDLIQNNDSYFVLGNINDSTSYLRGFDHNNYLNFYLNLGYLDGITFYREKFVVSYNSQNSQNSLLQDLRLEMDYFGRIYTISTDLSDINYNINLTNNDNVDYIGNGYSFYADLTSNYNPIDEVDNISYTPKTKLNINDYIESLKTAYIFNGNYKLSTNGEYITFDFGSNFPADMLILTTDGELYSYDIANTNIIKTDITGTKAIFLKYADDYYTIMTNIE